MKFVKNRNELNDDVKKAFLRSVDECVADADENAPRSVSRGVKLNQGDVQGGLAASLTSRVTKESKDELVAEFGSALIYAAQREFGGTITPKRGKYLVWTDPATGKKVFAKSVTQRPGGPRQGYKPFIRPAGEKFGEFMGDHLAHGGLL